MQRSTSYAALYKRLAYMYKNKNTDQIYIYIYIYILMKKIMIISLLQKSTG